MADKSHGVLLSCRRARGFESKRTNEPPTECRGCEVRPRLALALRGLSWFIPTSHTQHATCYGSPTAPSPTTRGASDPLFRVRRFGPLSQPSGPKPGMGQVPSSRTAGLIGFSSGEMEADNLRIRAHRSENQSGTSIRRPSGGWLSRGFPGSPLPKTAPILEPESHADKALRIEDVLAACWKSESVVRGAGPGVRGWV